MTRVKRTMVECAKKGCKRLVMPSQGHCWKHKLKRHDDVRARIRRRGKRCE